MSELNGVRALTPAEFEAEHPLESADADARIADYNARIADADARARINTLLSGSDRTIAELDTLLGATPPLSTPTLETVLQKRAARMTANGHPATQIIAELRRLRDAWTPFEGVHPTFKYTARRWLVEHLIPLGLAGVLNGPGDAGKSTLALQLAYELAQEPDQGFDFIGFERGKFDTRPRRTMIACYEDDLDEINRRFYRINGRSSEVSPTLTKRLLIMPHMSRHGPMWSAKHPAQPGEPTVAWDGVLNAAAEFNADLLILDPLATVYLDDENARGRVRRFMDSLNAWANDHATELSGNTDWHGAARFSLGLEPEPKAAEIRRWERAFIAVPDILQETAVLQPGKGNYVARGDVRGRYLRLPKDKRWEFCDPDKVKAAKEDVEAALKKKNTPSAKPRKTKKRDVANRRDPAQNALPAVGDTDSYFE